MNLTISILLLTTVAAGLSQAQHDAARKRILVLCTRNSARSQMAAGFLQSFSPKLEVHSAGLSHLPGLTLTLSR